MLMPKKAPAAAAVNQQPGGSLQVAVVRQVNGNETAAVSTDEPIDRARIAQAVEILDRYVEKSSLARVAKALMRVAKFDISREGLRGALETARSKGRMRAELVEGAERLAEVSIKDIDGEVDEHLEPAPATLPELYPNRRAAMPIIRKLVPEEVAAAIETMTLKEGEEHQQDIQHWVQRALDLARQLATWRVEASKIDGLEDDPDAPAVAPEELAASAAKARKRGGKK